MGNDLDCGPIPDLPRATGLRLRCTRAPVIEPYVFPKAARQIVVPISHVALSPSRPYHRAPPVLPVLGHVSSSCPRDRIIMSQGLPDGGRTSCFARAGSSRSADVVAAASRTRNVLQAPEDRSMLSTRIDLLMDNISSIGKHDHSV